MAHRRIRVLRLTESATLPSYAHGHDAGMDLASAEALTITAGARRLVRTGLVIQLPPSTEGQVRPRSGLALKHGITVLNSPGTIDEGFRGEISILLINHGDADFEVSIGMKIAQLVISDWAKFDIDEVNDIGELDISDRGTRGFGSTDTV